MLGRGRMGGFGLAAALAMVGVGVGGMAQPAPTVQMNMRHRGQKKFFGGYTIDPNFRWNYGGPGTTMAQQKRASTKKRNQARHKAHSKR